MPESQLSWVRSQHPPTVESEGRQMKQCWISYIKKEKIQKCPFKNCFAAWRMRRTMAQSVTILTLLKMASKGKLSISIWPPNWDLNLKAALLTSGLPFKLRCLPQDGLQRQVVNFKMISKLEIITSRWPPKINFQSQEGLQSYENISGFYHIAHD
jgi:hypothetical protein